MNIDMTQPIVDRDGKPLPVVLRGEHGQMIADPLGAIITLSHVCVTAAEAQLPVDQNKGWREKHELGRLADKAVNDSAHFSAEEVAILKERIGLVYGAYVVRRAIDMLDPPAS